MKHIVFAFISLGWISAVCAQHIEGDSVAQPSGWSASVSPDAVHTQLEEVKSRDAASVVRSSKGYVMTWNLDLPLQALPYFWIQNGEVTQKTDAIRLDQPFCTVTRSREAFQKSPEIILRKGQSIRVLGAAGSLPRSSMALVPLDFDSRNEWGLLQMLCLVGSQRDPKKPAELTEKDLLKVLSTGRFSRMATLKRVR